MNDEVGNAHFIGAAINKGLVGIPTPKKKKKSGSDDEEETKTKGPKKVKSERVKSEKSDPNIIDAEIVPNTPLHVSSERTNAPAEIKSLGFNRYDIPTHGPGSEFNDNPNMGRQFR